ncbi:hypothetical protein BDZ89DRAFT_1114708 [Hymenopellis radicata]|nr:hypothetical protein BDZ89DRAFT_1114708 [Hymenopellis radicata]
MDRRKAAHHRIFHVVEAALQYFHQPTRRKFAEAPSATYTTKGSKKQMLKVFSDFCPMIQRMLDFVPEGEVCEWKMRVHAPLPTWVHHQVTLVGDACHPTLPHLAQGAAQAIEDAAVLSVVLSMMRTTPPKLSTRRYWCTKCWEGANRHPGGSCCSIRKAFTSWRRCREKKSVIDSLQRLWRSSTGGAG